jgi:proline dehydrogenase
VTALWQAAMIRLARSARMRDLAQRQPRMSGLASRFVGGADIGAALATALALRSQGISTSLYYLGEYVEDPEVIAATMSQLRAVTEALASEDLDVSVSVDPTQLGLMISEAACEANVRQLAEAVARARSQHPLPGRDAVMLDMEDAGTTEATLRLHGRLRGEGLPVAVTVQAYLHRTAADLRSLAAAGAWVRLVKGAFAEPATIAARQGAQISHRYRRGAAVLLGQQARAAHSYPSFATHDDLIIEELIAMAGAAGWPGDGFEFEMLYGVRPDLQRSLAQRGYRVRVYVPFGADWFPYAVRRVGESPRNLRFAVTAMIRSRQGRTSGELGGSRCSAPLP